LKLVVGEIYSVLVGTFEVKKRNGGGQDIKMILIGTEWEGAYFIYLIHDRVRQWAFVNMVMNLRVL
jgi:hypothetical protein